jgi:phage baseplate assembly protein W
MTMANLYGNSTINITDPNFGLMTADADILQQRGVIALSTPAGNLDGFPEFGIEFDGQVSQALSPTKLAMLPLKVRTALEQEPSIQTAEVTVQSSTSTGDGGVALTLGIQLTGATGDQTGFTVANEP